MKNSSRHLVFALTLLGMATPALAVECTSAPAEKWMKPEDVQKLLVSQGYDIRSVKKEDSCLEAKGFKDGKKMEVYVDPVSGKIVKIKEK